MVDQEQGPQLYNPYLQEEGQGVVVENTEQQLVVIREPDGTERVVGGMTEKTEINLATGGRRVQRAQLLIRTDDGRLIVNPTERGGEVYVCGGKCKRLCSAASIRFCQCQVPICLSCAKREEDELGRNLYFCGPCHKKWWWKKVKRWVFSLGRA